MFEFYQIEPLSDGVITLRLRECVPIEIDTWANSYNFDICKADSFTPIGHIHLRIGMNERVYYGGNIGYGVHARERGNGLAVRAVKLIPPVARLHNMSEIIITCAPDNLASIKTIERCGGRYLGTSTIPHWSDLYQREIYKVCRYILEI